MGERPPVLIGERVFWLGSGSGLPKSGKVKWIGRLAEMGPDWAVGLELDEALPYGGIDGTWGHRKLFSCKRKHGLIVPLSSVIPQPNHIKPGEPFGRTLRNCGKTGSQELAELAPPNKPESKVGKLFRALSNDESSQRNKYEDLELPSTHLRNPNLERQLAILGTLRRSNLLEQARLEGVKSEACLYSVVLEKEENVFRERRRMIHGREFKRSDDTLDRTSSIHSSRSSGGSSRRDRTSGIFSFFRWFRKEKSEDSEGDSPPSPSSPVLRRANGSITGSVDTLFSTATTRSFAFVPPSHYRPYGAANPPEIRINPGPETNTYRNRIRQRDLLRQKEQHISLREKYRLYASETLPRSVDRINEISGAADNDSPSSSKNSTFKRQKRRAPPPPVTKSSSTSENSLPTFSTEINDGQDIGRQHRRTLSEPSPTRYIRPCHVKGKRKAPSPPNNSNASNSNNIAQSSQSDRTLSLHRKKRRAPPPPIQRSPSDEITEILQRAFEDITGSDTSLNRLETVSNASTVDISQADIVATDTLRLERGYLKPNREEKPMDLKYKPTSPVSPRPWYKRNAATRENSFSRSNERKKEREKRRVEDWMIESGIPRRSNQLPESRLNVFAKMDKTEEKRRSQISILTNISELDREAAEIVRKNKEKQQALLANKNDRFYDGGNCAMSNGYFGNVDHNQTANAAENLVSLLNSITNVTNVTLNSAFFLQDSNFREQAPKPEDHVIRRVVVDEQEIRIVDNPTPVVTEPEPEPGPSGLGKITKVTIEELDDFDKERNSRAQALYEANRLQRNQVPFIPTITEVSESTVTSPTSTVANTPSDPVAPPIPGATTPSATSPDESKALQKVPIQIPASVMKPVVHVIWNCPRCTLENPRWKVTCEACDMWRPVPCDFKEVKPKHPLPLAVLRIVEPKDQNVPGTVKITEIKDDNSSATNKVPLTNGVEAKPEGPNDKGSLNLDLKDNKSKRSSQGLTISDLLFNTQGNSSPKDSTWYKDILNGLNLPPSTTTYKEYTNNLQKKQVNAEKAFVSDKSLVSDKPLNTNKLPFNSNIPTPSASGSSISSLSSTNSEKPSTSASGQRSTKGDIVEPEEIRKARLAFFEKYGQPSTSKTPNQSTKLSSESKGEADTNKTSDSVKIIESPKVSPKSKVLVQHNSSAQNEDSKLPLNTNKLPQAENIETKTARTTTENLGKPVESRLCKSSDTKLEQSPSVKHRSISRNEESSVKDTQTTEIPYKVVLSNDQEEDKRKLREMLKEMKHSLPKRSKDDKVSQKSSNTEEISKKVTELIRTEDQVKSEIRSPKLGAIRKTAFVKPQNPTENNYKHGPSEKAEAYLVESETIVEEIKIKKPQPGKVSSAAQTSAMVRQLTPQVKPPSGKEVVVPITVEEYTIQDGVLYTSVSKKAKRIGSGTFQLMRPRDFANIEAIKTRGSGAGGAPTYANVSSEVDKPASDGGVTSKTKEVEKLSLQLTEPQGLAHFRAGLASTNEANNMNTIAVNRLLRRLESAIANGQHELAAALAKELAQLKVNCVVTRQKPETPTSQIQIDMYVEDKENHQGPFPLQMKPSATVEQLKLKVEREYEIPCDVQRWIIGKALANDDKATLESMGVTESGAAVYLYLVVPEDPALSVPQLPQNELVSKVLEGLNNLEGAVGGELPKSCNTVQEKTVITVEMPEENNASSTHRTETDITIEEIPTPKDGIREEVRPARFEKQDTGWRCGRCTLVNSPGRPGCAACGSERPNEREVVVEAPTDQKKPLAIPTDDKKKEEEQPAKAIEEEKKRDYQKLVDLEKSDLIICTETFECPICIVEYQPFEGVVLRECLHVFCRACLANTVEYSDEAEVKCPFRNDKYTCDSTLLEREIKALVTPEAYEQHLAKSIALAETKIGNAFHCKTPDCKGWCIFEDNVNLFRCPVCTHTNCLTCQAVHEGMDCKEFQEQLNKDSEVNVESKRTKEMLQEMVDRGEAMNCPTCQVVLMKKWGCDWLRCSMCKTEICWITRGPRWGPNGKGDTSGGCQCGVNGIKCHPKCTYCH